MANPVTLPDQAIGEASYEAGDGIAIQNDTISVKVDGSSVTFNASGELQASGGSGTEYSAGDGISISDEDVISTKLAEGSGLRIDNGGLQIVHQLATPSAEDEGKVLTVTNSLGAYAWADPQGGSSTVATSGCITGDGSQASPINLSYDTNTLVSTQNNVSLTIGAGAYGSAGLISGGSTVANALAAGSCNFAFHITNYNSMVSSYTARVWLYCPTTDENLWGPETTLQKSQTYPQTFPNPAILSIDVSSSATYDASKDWEVYISVTSGSLTFDTVVYQTNTYKLAVTNPLPASLGTAGQVLSVNSGANGVEWKTLNALPSYSDSDSTKVLRVNNMGTACIWDDQVKCFRYNSSISSYYDVISEACSVVVLLGYPQVCMIVPGGSTVTGYPLNSGALYTSDNVLLTLVSYDSTWATTDNRCIAFSGITWVGSDLYAITYKQYSTGSFMRTNTHSLTASKLSIST